MATADELFAEHGVEGIIEPEPGGVATEQELEAPDAAPEPTARQKAVEQRARDDAGKFAKEKVEKAEKPTAKMVIDDISSDVDDAPEPEAEPDVPVVAEAPPVPEVQPVPWKFGWAGKEVSVPGALHKPGVGVFIPEPTAEQKAQGIDPIGIVRQAMLHAGKLPQLRQQLAEQSQRMQGSVTRHSLENAAFVKVFGAFLDPATGKDALAQAAADPLTIDRWRLALQQAQIEIERQVGAANIVDPAQAGQPPQELVNEVFANLDDVFEREVQAAWPDITPAEKAALEQRAAPRVQAFLEKAAQDDPEGRWTAGGIGISSREMRAYILGVKAERLPAAAPTPAPLPPKPVAAPIPQKVAVPPGVGGPAKNVAGTSSGKPRPKDGSGFASKSDVKRYFDSPDV